MAEDEDKVTVEGQRAPTRGAQVVLTGEAQEAARGGYPGDIEGNTLVKRALEADGTVPDGYGPDGSAADKPAADAVVTEGGEPGGSVPAAAGSTRVEVKEAEVPDVAPQQKPVAAPVVPVSKA